MFGVDTVDSILSDFQKKINKLHALVERNNTQIIENSKIIVERQNNTEALTIDNTRAMNVAEKLQGLLQ